MDLHVSVARLDLVEHPGAEEGDGAIRPEAGCLSAGVTLLTCRTACRERTQPVSAREAPLPQQSVCSLACSWASSVRKEHLRALTDLCIPQRNCLTGGGG